MDDDMNICVVSPNNSLYTFLDKKAIIFDFYFDVYNIDKTKFYDYYIVAVKENTIKILNSINSDRSGFILFGKCCEDIGRIKEIIKYKIIACIEETQLGMQELLNLIHSLNKTKKTITEAKKKLNKLIYN